MVVCGFVGLATKRSGEMDVWPMRRIHGQMLKHTDCDEDMVLEPWLGDIAKQICFSTCWWYLISISMLMYLSEMTKVKNHHLFQPLMPRSKSTSQSWPFFRIQFFIKWIQYLYSTFAFICTSMTVFMHSRTKIIQILYQI